MAKAYLAITLKIAQPDRSNAGAVYARYKKPFLDGIDGAVSKELLIREDDVQVLHGFQTAEKAANYLKSPLFTDDIVKALKPYLKTDPDVRIYESV